MNTQINSRSATTSAAQQRTMQGTWSPPDASMTPFACAETERENARLRLALREAHHRSGNQWQLLIGLAELERMQSPQDCGRGQQYASPRYDVCFCHPQPALDTDAGVLKGNRKVGVRDALENILAQLQAADGGARPCFYGAGRLADRAGMRRAPADLRRVGV